MCLEIGPAAFAPHLTTEKLTMLRSAQWVLVLFVCVVLGCQKNPAQMTQTEVEALLKSNVTFKEMSITPNPSGGGYTGSGKGTDGTPYKITVTQDVQARKLTYAIVSEVDPDENYKGVMELK
jgi:hypothetical protein